MSGAVTEEIRRLKDQRGALILAHSYQPGPVQDLADHVGDSLELSRIAASEAPDMVILCGVRFMAETAKLLAPESVVILPAPEAGCSLAASMSAEDLRGMKERYPGVPAVIYVNSSVEAKAEAWACCTSANSIEVSNAAPGSELIFGPDRNLGTWVERNCEKKLHLWHGGCHAHSGGDIRDLIEAKAEWPDAEVLVHPETPPVFWDKADMVLGTGGMIQQIRGSGRERFIIGTEEGMIYRLEALFPEKRFRAVGGIVCRDMGYTTPELVLKALESPGNGIHIPPFLAERASRAVMRMTEIG